MKWIKFLLNIFTDDLLWLKTTMKWFMKWTFFQKSQSSFMRVHSINTYQLNFDVCHQWLKSNRELSVQIKQNISFIICCERVARQCQKRWFHIQSDAFSSQFLDGSNKSSRTLAAISFTAHCGFQTHVSETEK